MSDADRGPVSRREVAQRLFAAEYNDADLEYSDSAEERAPNYVVTPTGGRINRLFVVGVLTEVESVSDDVLRARVVDPTGAFVVYAGQYQPEAVAFLEDADVPSFVAVTGKARTFQPDGSDRTFTSVRPEAITAVDAATRDRWTVQAAEHTLARIATLADALERDTRGDDLVRDLESAGVEPGLASGVALAIDHYGTDRGYLAALRDVAVAAVEVVAGDREAVPDLDVAPAEASGVDRDLAAAPAVAGTITGPSVHEPRAVPAADAPSTVDTPTATEAEASADVASEARAEPMTTADDDLGDFDPAGDAPSTVEPDDEPYELDDEEREAVEAEFGTEFSTGSEVGAPGEAGLDTETAPPATEASGADPAAAEPTVDDELVEPTEGTAADGPGAEETEAEPEESTPDEPVDFEDAVVAAMRDLDEGEGAPREAVVTSVAETHDADPEAVEAAVQDALMGGRCYEPDDGRLKAI